MTLPLSTPRVLAAGALDIARSTQAQAHNELCSATIQVTNVHARRPLETRRVSPQICSCTDKNRYFTRSADPGLLRCLRESRGSKDIITDSGCASALNRNKCIIQQQTMHCKQEHTHEQTKTCLFHLVLAHFVRFRLFVLPSFPSSYPLSFFLVLTSLSSWCSRRISLNLSLQPPTVAVLGYAPQASQQTLHALPLIAAASTNNV